MSVLFLTEADVDTLIDMPASIRAVERAFEALADGQAHNVPRARAQGPGLLLHMMSAAAEYLGLAGWKAYTTTRQGAQFHVGAYDLASGRMVAMIQADRLGQLRTGAASGVATRHLARADATTLGLLGAGWQAQSQLEAVCCVREIRQVRVYCRDETRRREFAEAMSDRCGVAVEPVESAEAAVDGADILVTATTAREPLFDGQRLEPGVHLNVIGSNQLAKAEVDVTTVTRADRLVCDSLEQCRIEAGELAAASEASEATSWSWDDCSELAPIVAGTLPGRTDDGEITFFKSVGLAIEDVAMAAELISRAREQGAGQQLPLD